MNVIRKEMTGNTVRELCFLAFCCAILIVIVINQTKHEVFVPLILSTRGVQVKSDPDPVKVKPASAEKVRNIVESKSLSKAIELATSGKEFSGDRVREFPSNSRQFNNGKIAKKCKASARKLCSKWGVLTTINEPTEAIRRFLYRKDWCIIVVGDLTLPKRYHYNSTLSSNVFFLSGTLQSKMIVNDFVEGLPWNSFGRKNIGYLFAIAKGARVIWDFDDDNLLKFWMKGASPDASLEIDSFESQDAMIAAGCKVKTPLGNLSTMIQPFNPYPELRSPDPEAWPRGYPFNSILGQTVPSLRTQVSPEKKSIQIGVLQSLADIQPDVDAIYRLTRKTPFLFKRPDIDNKKLISYQRTNAGKPMATGEALILSSKEFVAPYNAQATLHWYDAFWALFLPVTVTGRVSDIWRSYFAQAVFSKLNMGIAFLPRPLVVQERNPHDIMGDLVAEQDLYLKTDALIDRMQQFAKSNQTFINVEDMIESAYIWFYEHGFIDIDDVYHVQRWIKALANVGYRFPNLPNQKSSGNIKEMAQCTDPFGHLDIKTLAEEAATEFSTNKNKIHHQCPVSGVRFATADLHSGVLDDITSTLPNVNQSLLRMGRKWKSSNYPETLKLPGLSFISRKSTELKTYISHSTQLRDDWPLENFNFYKNISDVLATEAFVCGFPAAMCQLWREFKDASTIFIPAHRYNLGRCNEKDWHDLDKWLRTLSKCKRNTIGAMSRYDMEYLKYYTGIQPLFVPAFSGFYAGHYKPSRKEILIFGNNEKFEAAVGEALRPEFEAVANKELYKHYTQDELGEHRAIIMLPYSVMSYKTVEFYSITIPLFYPSPKFFLPHEDEPKWTRTGFGSDRTSTTPPYCWNASLEVPMRPSIDKGFSSHVYSPNMEFMDDVEAEMYWLQLCDFYDWPHVQLFDNFQHLKQLMLKANFQEIHQSMVKEMEFKKAHVKRTWCDIATRVRKSKC